MPRSAFFIPAVILFTASSLPGQTSDAATQALLLEVRQLRLAIERSTSVTLQTQLLVQRLQVQEGRMARLKQELERAGNDAVAMQREQAHINDLARRFEAEAGSAATPALRKESLAREVEVYKRQAVEAGSRESQMRARESALAGEFRGEQSKLTELQDRLTEIDRSLETALRNATASPARAQP